MKRSRRTAFGVIILALGLALGACGASAPGGTSTTTVPTIGTGVEPTTGTGTGLETAEPTTGTGLETTMPVTGTEMIGPSETTTTTGTTTP